MLQSKLKLTKDTIAYLRWKKCIKIDKNANNNKCKLLYEKYIKTKKERYF
jgi:hypothetical protein